MSKDYIVTITDGDFDVTVNTDGEYIVNIGEYISGVGFSNKGTGAEVLDEASIASNMQFRTLVEQTEAKKSNIEISQGSDSITIGTSQDISARNIFADSLEAQTGNLIVQNGTMTTLNVGNSVTTSNLVLNGGMSGPGNINITGNVTAPNLNFSGSITGSDYNNVVTIDAPSNQNMTITTDSDHYIHANTGDLYVGPLSGAVKIDENSISVTTGTLTVTGNLVGNVTGQVSDISNFDTDDLTEGTNKFFTTAALNTELGSVGVDIIPDTTLTRNLGSVDKAWHSAYVGPGSLYIDGQKVLGSDASGDIDITTDSGQNLHLSSGADIILLPQAGEVDQGFRVELDRIELGNDGDSTTTVEGTLSASDVSIGDLDISGTLINQTGINQNIEIRTNGTGYLHANTSGAAYFGAFSSAISVDGALKTVSAIGGDINIGSNANTLNLNTVGTLDVSGDTTLAGLTVEGSNSNKSTVVGDSLIAGTYASHGFTVNADDTSWAGINLIEYVGGTNKPINSFSNATIAAEVYGGTPSAKTNVVSGKRLLTIQGLAANETDGSLPTFANFRIKGETTEDQTTANRGTKLSFESIANGSNSTTETISLQGAEVTINPAGNGTLKSGGNLTLDDDVTVENTLYVKGTADFDSAVNMDNNLQVDGTLTVDGDTSLKGNTTIGDANTDAVTVNAIMDVQNGLKLPVLDTATANYLGGVLGLVPEGGIAYITDGDSGSKCIAVFNGSSWKRISFGSDISST